MRFDVSRTSIAATAVDPLGHRLRQEKLGTSDEEIQQFLTDLPRPIRVVLEACNVWEHVHDAATSTGAEVLLANPFQTKLVSNTTLKTDRGDSEKLSELARLDAIPEAHIPSPEQRAVRKLLRERMYYTQLWTGVASHTCAVFLQEGIPFRSGLLQRRTLRSSVVDPRFLEIERGLRELASSEEIAPDLERAMRAAFEASEEAQLRATIPGVRQFTSIALVAFLGPIERFESLDAVVKYCGLCPSVHQSGMTSYNGRSCGMRITFSSGSWSRSSGTSVATRRRLMCIESAIGSRIGSTEGAEWWPPHRSSYGSPPRFSADDLPTKLAPLSRRAASGRLRRRETAAPAIVPGGDSGVRGP